MQCHGTNLGEFRKVVRVNFKKIMYFWDFGAKLCKEKKRNS